MASSKLQAALTNAANSNDKSAAYSQILNEVTTSTYSSSDEQADNLILYFNSLSSSSLGIISTKPLLTSLIQSLHSAPAQVKIKVGGHIAENLQSQTASFEEQNANVREVLAQGYEAEEEWSKAAEALQGIQLDSTQRSVTDLVKVSTWIRIVRCYLEDEDTVKAESALNRIKNHTPALQVLQEHPDLHLHFQLAQARILDSRRDFLNASAEYLNVSFNRSVAEDDRLQALSAAIKTAVLAPAGPQRTRTLGRLYKDERSMDTQEYGILEKMFLDRLLSAQEVDTFAASLAEHQLALTADGSTVLSKAVTEHNLLAASKLYDNISTSSLAEILGLKDSKDGTAAERAEDYAARMIEQGRLRAEIDQIDLVIHFEAVPGLSLTGATRDLRLWDLGVQGLVEDVERYAAAIGEEFPNLAAQGMVNG
ncbi:hypothetical protein LTS08_000277 [Lithohypha guttulata]|uniref:COP9 signalosome complex subunit 4 n=1 Tax=Lithohypha guttulata TaxID=1690604 RepID=A0AAN7SXN1_9EURO|nr:hypothetical protein LTR51_007102 [Lithohypha guttulata]KAK5084290.1 hypothetical protein LTR05_005366 [Lithohypha guttulata]KAK5106160.1 hypothetical protein LTS08_000277 [Lithohypha guttulata]